MSTDKTPLNNWEPKFELKFPEKKIKLIINNHLKLKPINSTLNHSYSLANLPINMNDMVYVKSPNAKNIENLEPSSNRIPRVSGKNLPDVFTSPTSAGLKLK